jgi:hypothetical protein
LHFDPAVVRAFDRVADAFAAVTDDEGLDDLAYLPV